LYKEAKERFDRKGMEQYKEKTLLHYRAAANLKEPWSTSNLGSLAYIGTFGPKDFREAYSRFTAAAALGHTEARRLLGYMHEHGEGVPVTPREAAYHYRIAALAGDKLALGALCDLLQSGIGLPRDPERMKYWFKLLEDKGESRGAMMLGDLAMQQKDYGSALKIFQQLAGGKDPRLQGYAYAGLSQIFGAGLGVPKDLKLAHDYYVKAADLGSDRAMYADAMSLIRAGKKSAAIPLLERAVTTWPAVGFVLGRMYLQGEGVAKNPRKAIECFTRAARAGNSSAQLSLAVLSLAKVPGAPVLDEALRLAEAAEATGLRNAKAVREQLEAKRNM
jgi:TPR repeat protein